MSNTASNNSNKHREMQILTAISRAASVAITTPQGIITYVNDNYRELCGYAEEELLGNTHRLLNSGYHDKIFYETLWHTLMSGQTWKGRFCNRAKSGKLYWIESAVTPLKDETGQVVEFLSISHDITYEMMKRQQELSDARMLALGQMAANIAHEINNPLAIINGYAGQIVSITDTAKPINTDQVNDIGHRIISNVERISKIITGLRAIARDGSQDPFEMYSAYQLIHDTLELCSQRLKKSQIRLEVSEIDKSQQIRCRPSQLGQVLINLLNNSVDAIQDLKDKCIRITVESNQSHIFIAVTDSGGPIPTSVRDKLFQAYFTTKGPGKGTGIGLCLSKKIAEEHGGDLYLETKAPTTSFVVKLPRPETTRT